MLFRSDLLALSDILICALPLTDATRHILNADSFAKLPRGAAVVNMGRGGHLDQAALLAALDSGQVGAAMLDVTDPEPLPPEHPLWRTPGVLITPHVGGDTTAFEPRARRMVAEQLRRWSTGLPLAGVIRP